ncbi:MAG: histidine kinase [Chitinispirillaceae bacterium]|nr:histidine kinase [Chitinispirillaceae bacterium]
MLSRMDGSLRRLSALGDHAVNQQQLAAVDLVRMLAFDHRKETELSIEVGFNRLRAMGINLPERPSIFYLIVNMGMAAIAMRRIIRSGNDDSSVSSAVPDTILFSFRILSRLWLYAFTFQNHRVVAAIVTHLILRTRTYGQFSAASVAICFWGILTGMLTRNPLKGLCGQAIISIENALFHDLEIKQLQSKVNPHFLFNALSSIAELCHTDPDATEDAIIKLSTLYRYVLTAEMRLVTLEEELEIIRKYLDIEKLRFGNRLSYEVRINGDPSLVRMPCMLIQPLVENSIKHGISPRPSGGRITITIAITDTRCDVTVEDDGAGPDKSSPGTGYGLGSIKKRLELQYNNDAVFEINNADGFKVHFSLPVIPG